MTRCRCHYVLVTAVLLVLGSGSAARGQERIKPMGVEIQTQQLPQPEKVAVRERPHAELKVAHVAHTPAPAKEGQSIAIEIKVENEGTAPSSGDEILHFDCQNTQPGGPACPFGAGQRSLPAIHSFSEPYPTGPYAHSVQLLTVPSWKAGTYQMTAWIVVPGSQFSETFSATIEVGPKLKLSPEAASQVDPQAAPMDESAEMKVLQIDPGIVLEPISEPPGPPDLVVIVEGPKFRVKNQGGTSSSMVPLRWSCSTYGSVPLGACSWFGENGSIVDFLPGLDPGEEWVRYLETASTIQACPANNFIVKCTFTLAVDPSNMLTEIAETNNSGSYNKQAY